MVRKTKYHSTVYPKLDLIEGWARDGLTMDDIAHNLRISKTTLTKYKRQYPELDARISSGREIADYRVENALYKKATGYYAEEEKVVVSDGEPTVVKYNRYYPPDTTAIIFWLKNRKPDLWRDKIEASLNQEEPGIITIAAERIQNEYMDTATETG